MLVVDSKFVTLEVIPFRFVSKVAAFSFTVVTSFDTAKIDSSTSSGAGDQSVGLLPFSSLAHLYFSVVEVEIDVSAFAIYKAIYSFPDCIVTLT